MYLKCIISEVWPVINKYVFINIQRIQVYFHVIIPVAVWDWNNHCYLAINILPGQKLTYLYVSKSYPWYVCGVNLLMYCELISLPFCICRDKYGAVEVKAWVYLSSDYVNKQIPYKYYVHHSNGSYYPEYNHDQSIACNRCLELRHQHSGNTLIKQENWCTPATGQHTPVF